MKEMLIKKMNKKGFTLAELLIVVAIIAVLVAISIPIFTSQLEKSREAADAANIRAAYAEMMSAAVSGEECNVTADDNASYSITTSGTEGSFVYTATIPLEQKQAGWQNTTIDNIGGVKVPAAVASGTCTVTYTQETDKLEITIA